MNVVLLWVVYAALFFNIKMSATARVATDACNVLPVTPIGCDIVIEQLRFKLGCTVMPIDA